MESINALDAYGAQGPRLRRWKARLLTELRQGQGRVFALLFLALSAAVTVAVGFTAVS